ncbi:IS3 family transposase [Paenibacillus lycopersici]|uniref:IS3 family transposase n=1 Tax=Paenibacillus lycopersici TaxID=2704462 RepID=A0A6C0G7W1_9BACL|nr:IS3 family transposase [Paenibacillus lycopersici]QHT63709.1 IS3 family transposase [Paenibacillus lycopersici]QHT63823.1 IS3 family transposase [Paenibacillus lycopersici]QHT63909.1 IS3 family transposase [Paenibacillus lycopersici]
MAHFQQSKELRFQLIDEHRSEFRVEKMCVVLGVSKSGYYKWLEATPSERQLRKKQLTERITWHFYDSQKRYGSPRIHNELVKEGWVVSERTVGKIMKENNLRSCMSGKFRVTTTDSKHQLPIAPNVLQQDFTATKPNQKWVADITYIPCRQGKLYLASILDLYTKQIVGWKLSNTMTTDLVLDALKQAYAAKKPAKGLIHHSDRGSQYASKEYRKQLKKYKMEASMSRRGNCYDNACIEAYHSILKRELIYCNPKFKTQAEAYQEIYRYLEFFYNRKRSNSTLGYISPYLFEQLYYEKNA